MIAEWSQSDCRVIAEWLQSDRRMIVEWSQGGASIVELIIHFITAATHQAKQQNSILLTEFDILSYFLPCTAWLLPSGLNSGFFAWMFSTLHHPISSFRVEFWILCLNVFYPAPPDFFLQGWVLDSLSECFLPCAAPFLPSGLNSEFFVWMFSTLHSLISSFRVEFWCKCQDNDYLLLYKPDRNCNKELFVL